MDNLYSTIHTLRTSAFNYVSSIIYDKVSDIITREHFGINQSCKYNHLQDYYYLIEVLTLIKKRIDCIVENDCLTYDLLKKVYDSYNLDCAIRCLACHNLPWKFLLDLFGIDLNYVKDSENKYLIRYTVQLLEEEKIVSSTIKYLGTKGEDYILDIENPDSDLYTYLSLYVDGKLITPLPTQYIFENLECIHDVVAKFRRKTCLDNPPVSIVITPTTVTQTSIVVSWNNTGTNVNYFVQLYQNGNVVQSTNTTGLTATFSNLLPTTLYQVRVTATNCAGVTTSQIDIETPPYIVFVEVINGTSTKSGPNVVLYNQSLLIDFTSVNAKVIISFTVDSVNIPFSSLNVTGFIFGQPQTGTYNLTNITSNKYVRIVYSDYDVCSEIDLTYNQTTNTITIQ